jgi:hypothetical protein
VVLIRFGFSGRGRFAVGGRPAWCGQYPPAERWGSRSCGVAAPVRESGIVFGSALAVLVVREPVSLQAGGLATIGGILVRVGRVLWRGVDTIARCPLCHATG